VRIAVPDDEHATLDVLYGRLRRLCGRTIRHERVGHTLEGTALANEVFLRLRQMAPDRLEAPLVSTRWFLAMASLAIRQAAVDSARAKRRIKRGRGWTRSLDDPAEIAAEPSESQDAVLVAHRLLLDLEAISPVQAQIAQLRFFAGMTWEQVAFVLDRSESSIRREWRFAQAWLGSRPEAIDWIGAHPDTAAGSATRRSQSSEV
jgi:RNA polymerase sigma factor (TIGR02999 family)